MMNDINMQDLNKNGNGSGDRLEKMIKIYDRYPQFKACLDSCFNCLDNEDVKDMDYKLGLNSPTNYATVGKILGKTFLKFSEYGEKEEYGIEMMKTLLSCDPDARNHNVKVFYFIDNHKTEQGKRVKEKNIEVKKDFEKYLAKVIGGYEVTEVPKDQDGKIIVPDDKIIVPDNMIVIDTENTVIYMDPKYKPCKEEKKETNDWDIYGPDNDKEYQVIGKMSRASHERAIKEGANIEVAMKVTTGPSKFPFSTKTAKIVADMGVKVFDRDDDNKYIAVLLGDDTTSDSFIYRELHKGYDDRNNIAATVNQYHKIGVFFVVENHPIVHEVMSQHFDREDIKKNLVTKEYLDTI